MFAPPTKMIVKNEALLTGLLGIDGIHENAEPVIEAAVSAYLVTRIVRMPLAVRIMPLW
jgi:hypothetical protein